MLGLCLLLNRQREAEEGDVELGYEEDWFLVEEDARVWERNERQEEEEEEMSESRGRCVMMLPREQMDVLRHEQQPQQHDVDDEHESEHDVEEMSFRGRKNEGEGDG